MNKFDNCSRNLETGSSFYYKQETDSTMKDAGDLILSGKAVHGDAVFAGFQSDGAGRLDGRKWESGAGESLLVSFIVDVDKVSISPHMIPLAAGAAVADFIQSIYNLDAKICWPNDVVVEGSKVSGILCRRSNKYVIAGIGINLNQTKFEEKQYKRKPTSIYKLSGEKIEPYRALKALSGFFMQHLKEADLAGFINENLYGKGCELTVSTGKPVYGSVKTGRIAGLSDDGALLVEKNGEVTSVYSGEIPQII